MNFLIEEKILIIKMFGSGSNCFDDSSGGSRGVPRVPWNPPLEKLATKLLKIKLMIKTYCLY